MLVPDFGAAAAAQMQQAAFEAARLGLSPDTRYKSDKAKQEDAHKPPPLEALTLFDQIVNSKSFKQTAMILFLNKRDLFEMKLAKKPLKQFYAPAKADDSLGDDTNPKMCGDFFKKLFLAKSKNPDKSIFTHITCATDTTNVKFVFNAVVAIILEENLKASGLA